MGADEVGLMETSCMMIRSPLEIDFVACICKMSLWVDMRAFVMFMSRVLAHHLVLVAPRGSSVLTPMRPS